MKSKATAYLLWCLCFFGICGAHKFYINKVGMGILYLFTFGFFGIGQFIDLFTLGSQVDTYNALIGGRGNSNINTNAQNIVVNVPSHGQYNAPSQGQHNVPDISDQLQKLSGLKDKGILSEAEFNTQKAKILG